MTVTSSTSIGKTHTRRLLLTALAAQLGLSACRRIIDGADFCPENPADSGGITWIPDIAHPVFYGVENLTPAQGAPRNMQIYYPGARFRAAPLLKLCIGRWPIVLFLHGMPPTQGASRQPWAHAWWRLPSTIARAGYVVVVPEHNAALWDSDPDQAVADALRDLEWVRNQWSGSRWLDKRPTSTVIAGHSYGALISALLVSRNQVGAFVSLGGPYILHGNALNALKTVTVPSFFMWARTSGDFENLDNVHFWEQTLTQNRYAAVYVGDHFDYVDASDTGPTARGACAHVGGVAGDLAALFIAANIQSLTHVDAGLHKPQPLTPLTPEQKVFADSYLNNLDFFMPPDCSMTLRWNVDGATGARQFGAI